MDILYNKLNTILVLHDEMIIQFFDKEKEYNRKYDIISKEKDDYKILNDENNIKLKK